MPSPSVNAPKAVPVGAPVAAESPNKAKKAAPKRKAPKKAANAKGGVKRKFEEDDENVGGGGFGKTRMFRVRDLNVVKFVNLD